MIKIWENFYVKSGKKNLFFPSETLVRCFKGDYIKRWDHPTLTEPTEAEIKAVTL